MNKFIKTTIWILFFSLVIGNVYVFMHGVKLGDEIGFYENEIKKLRKENTQLEQKVYKIDSVTYAASIAAELDYVYSDNALYIDQKGFAFNN